jgi:hypothetical protein
MSSILELTEDMVDPDRRDADGRRLVEGRRVDLVLSENWDPQKERRISDERRALDRRKRCVHCGETYSPRITGQPECACRLRAIHNPGSG